MYSFHRVRAAEVVAASDAAAVAASVVSRFSPSEPPQQEERSSPADDGGCENIKPSPLLLCHRRRLFALAVARLRVRPIHGPHRDKPRPPILRPAYACGGRFGKCVDKRAASLSGRQPIGF